MLRRRHLVPWMVALAALAAAQFLPFRHVASASADHAALLVANLAAMALSCYFVRRHFVEQRAAQERLRHQSLHDALTHLPNRLLFRDRLEVCLRRARRDPTYRFAVL